MLQGETPETAQEQGYRTSLTIPGAVTVPGEPRVVRPPGERQGSGVRWQCQPEVTSQGGNWR